MIRDPELPPNGTGVNILGVYSMKKQTNKQKPPNQTKKQIEGEWIYKIFRGANNMSREKLFTISNRRTRGLPIQESERSLKRKKKKEHSFKKTAQLFCIE